MQKLRRNLLSVISHIRTGLKKGTRLSRRIAAICKATKLGLLNGINATPVTFLLDAFGGTLVVILPAEVHVPFATRTNFFDSRDVTVQDEGVEEDAINYFSYWADREMTEVSTVRNLHARA